MKAFTLLFLACAVVATRAYAESHGATLLHMAAATIGVIQGEKSDNPEIAQAGWNGSATWVSDNTLITAAHCAEGAVLFDRSTKIEIRNGKEVEVTTVNNIPLTCTRHPKWKPFEPLPEGENLQKKVVAAFKEWKASGKKIGDEKDALFRKALEAWKKFSEEERDRPTFFQSARYDVAVCTIEKPDKKIKPACVVRKRPEFGADKNFIVSGFGLRELAKDGQYEGNEFGQQSQGKTKLEWGSGETEGLIKSLFKRGGPAVSAPHDSGGFVGEQIHASVTTPRQMRLAGVIQGADYLNESFDESRGEFVRTATNEKGGSFAVDLTSDAMAKDYLGKPELLPPNAKITYCD